MNYRETRFCENFNISRFEGFGEFDIPILEPCDFQSCEFIGYNFAKTAKNKENKGVHFFVDDYQFERLWRRPTQSIKAIDGFQYVMTPDFYKKTLQYLTRILRFVQEQGALRDAQPAEDG